MRILIVSLLSALTIIGMGVQPSSAAELELEQNFWKPHLKRYLQDKYPHIDEVTAEDIIRTRNGTIGKLTIMGRISPFRQLTGTTEEARAIEAVKNLMLEERELFGYKTNGEFEIDKVHSDFSADGDLNYRFNIMRVINGARVNAYFNAEVNHKGEIKWLSGTMEAIPPEAYELSSKSMISEDTVNSTILSDFNQSETGKRRNGRNEVKDLIKFIFPKEPFVVWIGNCGLFTYQVDPFTGKIIKKVRHPLIR
jgi:hypothetical protein